MLRISFVLLDRSNYTSAQTIFDMIAISMINFQIHGFFNIVVQKHGESALSSM